jgi:hypothetical protein
MDDLFKRTMRDIDLYSGVLKSMAARSVELGLETKDVTVHRAHLKVDAAIRDYIEIQEIAEDLGYSSVKIALKALKQMKQEPAYDLTKLPSVFHKVPAIWINGKPDNKLKKGFAPMRPRDAERQHRVIVPLLIEAWALAAGDEQVQQDIEKAYRNSSAVEFERDLYTYIYELEEPTLEEQLAERMEVKEAEFDDWREKNAEARALRESRRNGGAK